MKHTRICFLMDLALCVFSSDCQSNMLSVKTVSENTNKHDINNLNRSFVIASNFLGEFLRCTYDTPGAHC